MTVVQYYTVYRDEEIVAFGSSTQCAKKLGFKSKNSFYALISRLKSGIRDRYAFVIENVSNMEYFNFLAEV